jgi:hypothetical protein
MKRLLFLFIVLLSTPAFAGITNPQLINKMRAEVTELGSIAVAGSVSNIQLNLSIPQEDGYQKIEGFEVSDNNGLCSNSCSYVFVYDKFGNRVLSINWKNVASNINFKVKAAVYVDRRYSSDVKKFQDFLSPTNLVQSTDPEIADIASKARGTDFEKVAYLSKWINENIKYNPVYYDVNMPAKEILKLKIGVCKEFSNLLVSFLRNLGYYSAVTVGYVYPGKVYAGQDFQPHGWAEVYGNETILSDPTWAEVGFLDATHIKFATFPDSSWVFSSIYSTGFGNFKVNLLNTNVSVNLLDFEERPILTFSSSLLEDNLWKGYAVLKTDVSADRCLLTKFDVKSCNSVDGYFLEKVNNDSVIYFCNKKSFFTIFRIPDLQTNMRYSCPISVLAYGAEQQNVPLSLSYGKEGYTELSVDKTTVSPNEMIRASASNSEVFTDGGEYGLDNLDFSAPYYDFNVYSYNRGYLDQQRISVVSNKPVDSHLDVNDTALVGKTVSVLVVVRNLVGNPQEVTVSFREQSLKGIVYDTKNFSFNFTPATVKDNLIQTVVSTSDFSTALSKQINVVEDKGILDSFAQVIEDFLRFVSDFFNRLINLFR